MKRYNPPPNWPQPPHGWTPPPDWQPDPGWGPPPEGWQLWTEQAAPGIGVKAKVGLAVGVGLVALCGIGIVGAALSDDPDSARLASDTLASETTPAAADTEAADKEAADKEAADKAAADKAAADKAAADKAAADKAAADKAAADKAAADKAAADKAAADAAAAAEEAKRGSLAQQNAYGSAVSYLDFAAFSRAGLLDQLTSEYGGQFVVADAEFALARLEAEGAVDWNAEAAEAAKDYLEFSPFSRQALLDQLTSEYGGQFTPAQAEYGVSQAGL